MVSPRGRPTCLYANRGWKPSLNATQPYAKAEGCVHDDLRAEKLRKGWSFRVGTWNIDSLTGRAGELVEALAERLDVACVQETRWRGSGCRFFGAIVRFVDVACGRGVEGRRAADDVGRSPTAAASGGGPPGTPLSERT